MPYSIEQIDVSLLGLPEKGDAVDYLKKHPETTKENIENLPRIKPQPPALSLSDTWPKPVFLDRAKLPEFPADIFTGWAGDMIEAVSEATETPEELAAMMCLAAIATGCQKKFKVQVDAGYSEPLNIWPVAALDSGNRKTAVMQALTRPLLEWEKEKAEVVKQEINRVESERKITEARIQSLRGQAAKAKLDEFSRLKNEITDLETNLPEVPALPRLWTQDITPEKTGQLLCEHGEKLSILSDEGGIFDIMAGRYNGGVPNLDVFLQAHAGAPVRVDRGSRPAVYMQSPALTIGLSPQPDVLRGLADKPGFRGRGLLARFLYALPPSNLGYRSLATEPVPTDVEKHYHDGIWTLLEIQPPNDEQGNPVPYALRLSSAAKSEWKEFALVVESDMREGERFEHITDWAGKLPGAAIRIAGLFHCVEHAHGQPHAVEISLSTIQRALSLSAILSEHALAVFDLMGADPALDAARRVWRWIDRTHATSFTGRDCFAALRGHFRRMEYLNPAFEVLIERNYIFPIEEDVQRGAGRPKRAFTTNPTLSKGWK